MVCIFRFTSTSAFFSYAPCIGGNILRCRGSPEFAQISIDGVVRDCTRRGSLLARPRRCPFCIKSWFAFSGSPATWLSFHMQLALVQTLYRARGSPEFAQISIDGAVCNCSRGGSLLVRPRRCPFATEPWFAFSGYRPLSFLFTCSLHW